MATEAARPRLDWGRQEIRGPVHTYRERLMLQWLQRYVHGGKVLDAGFGTGSLMIALAERGFRICGVERSSAGTRWLAGKVARRKTLPSVGVVRGDAERLPFSTGRFDALMCGEVLEHLVDDASAVEGFGRVLRRGGVCIITVPAHPGLWSCCDEYAGHHRRYTREGLVNLFESQGFRVLSIGNWGFPLIRMYQRLVFRPYLARQQRRATSGAPPRRAPGKWLDVASWLLSRLFAADNIFLGGNWGVGFILAAEKITE